MSCRVVSCRVMSCCGTSRRVMSGLHRTWWLPCHLIHHTSNAVLDAKVACETCEGLSGEIAVAWNIGHELSRKGACALSSEVFGPTAEATTCWRSVWTAQFDMSRLCGARAVSKSPPGNAAVEDAGPPGRSEPRWDKPSLPVWRSPTRTSLTPGCDVLRPQLCGRSEPNAVRRSVRERAGCRGSGSWMEPGLGYLAECRLMPIWATAARG